MAITVRPADVADTEKCGDILYRAFQTIAENHNFPCDVPSVEAAIGMLTMLVADPGFYGIVAEHDGQIVGSGFADQRSRIAGIGRTLTQVVVDHFTARDFPGIRLVQTAYHNRSLCLYTTIGFQTREPLSVMQGPSLNIKFVGHDVRPATEVDAPSLQSSSSAS